MKTRLLALAVLSTASLFAQSLAGTWQGTVRPPDTKTDLRTVLKITADGDGYKANFFSIDQTTETFPTTVTAQGTTVKITIPGLGTGYEGKLSADGNTISGTIKKGFTDSVPWILKRVMSETEAWAIPKPPPPPKPMDDPDPSFEVATIKPTQPGANRGQRVGGQNYNAVNVTLANLITGSYDVHIRQVIGLPAWAESDRYNITAKPQGEGIPSAQQTRVMVRKLLADRFQLTFHRETREIPVFTITAAKSGLKISKSVDAKGKLNLFFRGTGNLSGTNATIADLATILQRSTLDRPVLDLTGLPAQYDFTLIWTPDQLAAAPTPIGPGLAERLDAPPDLATAAQQQLGLKIESTKHAIEVLVIDKVEKPSEN